MSEFLLTITFQGVEAETMLGKHARRINEEYMSEFGGDERLADTLFLLRLSGPMDFAIHYRGPEESAEWLEERIQEAARQEGGHADMRTALVEADVTEAY